MSRAYRIKVREAMKRVMRARDGVTTQLELLEILPPEEMAQLLTEELERRGFERHAGRLRRRQKGVTITVDPATGTVAAQAESSKEVELEGELKGYAYDDAGPGYQEEEKRLRESLREKLKGQAKQYEAELQARVTEQLEGELGDIRKELDQAVNRVTAEALKRKAAQLGQIKEMTEDPESGSLTIVLED